MSATPSFLDYRRMVEQLVESETPFWAVESAIDRAELPDDQRSALWLFAWSLSEREAPALAVPT